RWPSTPFQTSCGPSWRPWPRPRMTLGPAAGGRREIEAAMSGQIPWNWVDRQLRALRSIWVGTTRPGGRPHAVPVWFTWDGRTLYFATHESSQKARNLERQAWVVIHAGDGDDVIILEGVAEIVTDAVEFKQVDAARGE